LLSISKFASLKRQDSANCLKELVFLDAPRHEELLTKTLKVASLEVLRQAPGRAISLFLPDLQPQVKA